MQSLATRVYARVFLATSLEHCVTSYTRRTIYISSTILKTRSIVVGGSSSRESSPIAVHSCVYVCISLCDTILELILKEWLRWIVNSDAGSIHRLGWKRSRVLATMIVLARTGPPLLLQTKRTLHPQHRQKQRAGLRRLERRSTAPGKVSPSLVSASLENFATAETCL